METCIVLELTFDVLPLLLNETLPAIQPTVDLADLTNRVNSKQTQQRDFFSSVASELELLQLYLRKFVRTLPGLLDDQKEGLIDGLHELWTGETVQHAVGTKLETSDEAFLTALVGSLTALNGLLSDRTITQPCATTSELDTRFPRLEALRRAIAFEDSTDAEDIQGQNVFTRHQKRRAYHLRKLMAYNKEIINLLFPASEDTAGSPATSRQQAAPEGTTRELVRSLYEAMDKAWSCKCHPPHEARLCLLGNGVDRANPGVASLDMLFLVRPLQNDQNEAWQESNIRIIAEQHDTQSSPSISFQVGGPGGHTVGPRQEIRSLCSMVQGQGLSKISLGMEFANGTLWRTRPRKRRLSEPGLNGVEASPEVSTSLKDLLEHNMGVKMSLKERRTLAVIVAHAVLYFCNSPWLDKHWSKKHIFFLTKASSDEVIVSKPFLSTVFGDEEQHTDDDDELQILHSHLPILALGILLLELELCEPLEDKFEAGDREAGVPIANVNLFVAQRLLDRADGNIYGKYRNAIDQCLRFDAYPMLSEADHDAFRHEVYRKIVQPLEEELQHGFDDAWNDLNTLIFSGKADRRKHSTSSFSPTSPIIEQPEDETGRRLYNAPVHVHGGIVFQGDYQPQIAWPTRRQEL